MADAPVHLGNSTWCRTDRKGIQTQRKAKVLARKLIVTILFFTAEDEERLDWPKSRTTMD